jgi:hypothetical protein
MARVMKASSGRSWFQNESGRRNLKCLGSTTHHVIREGAWPVLTVRTGKR